MRSKFEDGRRLRRGRKKVRKERGGAEGYPTGRRRRKEGPRQRIPRQAMTNPVWECGSMVRAKEQKGEKWVTKKKNCSKMRGNGFEVHDFARSKNPKQKVNSLDGSVAGNSVRGRKGKGGVGGRGNWLIV